MGAKVRINFRMAKEEAEELKFSPWAQLSGGEGQGTRGRRMGLEGASVEWWKNEGGGK